MIEFYSNYGYALLGTIIEKASGERYEQYVQNHILDALGMKDSTVQQPLPPELVTRLAGGRFVYQHAASAAGLTTSADDLWRLLVAILHHGSPILSAASFDQMAPPTEVGVRLARGFGFFSGK
jgi:CubicO group peptidase (beta-lactamase class C family)